VDEAEDGSAGTVGNVDHARNARHRELPAWSMGMSHTDLTNVRLTPLAAQGMCVFHSLARPGSRAQQNLTKPEIAARVVPILARPKGRAQLARGV
jgi:hypothetical protein